MNGHFSRCVRPNGTAYGTRGKCKKGSEQAKQVVAPVPRKPRAAKPAVAKRGAAGYNSASDEERAAALDKEMGDSGKYGAEREKPSAKQAEINARAKQLGF